MSARANPTAIGIFVTGATALAVLALLVFGSGRIFRRQETFIIYFNESVNNLSDGSPVKFKGVQIGQVRRITLRYNQATDSSSVPVLIDIDLSRLRNNLGVEINLADEQVFDEQVRLGLRAKLQMQSLLTGLLYIDLDIYDELKGQVPPPIQETRIIRKFPLCPRA
jgi:paraquat-inducible protein B